ncbi:hypothetical protein ACFL6M_06920 [Candidatus Eisenbacteria bacterium]|uniref:MotA/TolQ/ExbB proton channel domain-containing protein n=1 Tax=Eiseniibacteriota bacterium TaxID=2212470 RepID=A0ABV6YLV6_UNCEI
MAHQVRRYSPFWGLLILIAVAAIGWFTMPRRIEFGDDILKDVPTMFGYLVLISLFVERAIEVVLSAWRSQGADLLDWTIRNKKKQLSEHETLSAEGPRPAQHSQTSIQTLKNELEKLEEDRVIYSAKSRFAAQWLGVGIGLLVALVGVRVLGNILNTSALTGKQAGAFIIVDVLVTGVVLAGGSEAINKIMRVYNSFMSSTEQKAKNRSGGTDQNSAG